MLNLNFPVGFHEFHQDPAINFQLNRWFSAGILDRDKLMTIGKQIHSFEEWTEVFLQLAEEARCQKKMEVCATYYRAAQFFTLGDEKDENGTLLKVVLYEKCAAAYEEAYKEEGITYDKIPYETGFLPVMYKKHEQSAKGVIVLHGGYDSFIQEFVRYMLYFYQAGFDIYMFEGPGQGEVLNRYQIKMRPDWEVCTSKVLDAYQLSNVTLIGISLGGYLAPRAASVDKRIQRVVMYDLIYDFYGSLLAKMKPAARRLVDYLTRHPKNLLWKSVTKKMNQNFFCNWLFRQGYFVYENVHNPCEYLNCIKQYNTRELSPKITQDVLILAGASDIYTIYYEDQRKALTNAISVESRIFTKEEQADHHCQIGNLKLVMDHIIDWVERKQKECL